MIIGKNKIRKTIGEISVFILMLLFVFSNFVSYLPEIIKGNRLAEYFKVQKSIAAVPIYIGAGNVGASTNAVTPSLPNGAIANDILLLVIETANQAITIPTPNGGIWTEIFSSPQGTGATGGATATRLTVFWSRYNGTQSNPTTSDSGDHQRARIFAFRGVIASGNPWDVAYGGVQAAASTTVSMPGGATTTADSLIVLLVANGTDTNQAQCGNVWNNSSLANLIEQSGDNTNQGNGGGTCLATGEKAIAGAFNPTTTTINTSSTQGFISIALKPQPPSNPNATSFINNTEGALLDGGRSSQQITISGSNFGSGPSDGTNNYIKIETYIVPNGNITTWNDTTIIFSIPASAATYGGAGAIGLTVRANGLDDATPLNFYIYSNITSLSANNGQIGSNITVNGDHFGASAGAIIINNKPATVIGAWNENNLTVRVPGQEDAANINGKIQITRSDARTSNQYPVSPANFIILAPSVSGSNPASETTGQISVPIEFSGLGIDTDIGNNPTLKLVKAGETDINGLGYSTITAYQTASATFNLSGAATGAWNLVITNDDGQSGVCSGCFTVNPPSGPVVTGINPDFGLNSGIKSITSITGSNFQNGATAKLTRTFQTDINPSTAFTFTNATTLSNGAFDLSSKPLGYWNVVVTNPDLQTGSYGNEFDAGFEIRSSAPSAPSNIYQFKNNSDIAQPPTAEITVGNGIGGQTEIYFRMDMEGGLSGATYYPQIELKTIGNPFDGIFVEGTGVAYSGTPVQGWVNITGVDGESYHWQARVRNSSGTSNWVSFGGNSDPNDIDIYIDNTLPSIDTPCSSASTNIIDLGATIQWNTSDATSGAQTPPGSGAYATSQIQYIKTNDYTSWGATPGIITAESIWENSPHQISLSSLSPGTDYTFRMKSKDGAQNEGVSANCAFTTEGARPIKTIEFFILQEANKNTGTKIKKNFILTVPENTGIAGSIQPKSAYIEIGGVSSATGNQTINAGLLRGDQTAEIGPLGNNYVLDSTGTTTQFTILFNALFPGSDNEDMFDITSGGNYEYTLFLNGDGITDISLFSAKLVLTYNYKP
jgi:hypothetical protein